MKKILLFASALVGLLLAGSCQREEFGLGGGDGTVSFTVSAPGAINTKAIADGMNVNEVHYAVYKTESTEEYSVENGAGPLAQGVVGMSNKRATVTLDLLQDQKYTVIFWAQVKDAGHYELGDLREIKAKNLTTDANDETRAAFYAVYPFSTETTQNYEVVLKRPFAQLNLGTSLESLNPSIEGQANKYMINVQESAVTIKNVSDVFSTVDDAAVEGELTYNFEATAIPALSGEKLEVKGEEYHYVGMNYVFVPSNDKLVEISYDITTDKGKVNNTIKNVPLKKNYRTNIIGNLLTSKTSFDIIVDEEFVEDKKDGEPIPPIYVWGGEVKEPSKNNEGVYEIDEPAELAWVAATVNSLVEVKSTTTENTIKAAANLNVKLTADIDLQNRPWVPIGANEADYQSYFFGKFDGNGKTIRNLKVDTNHGTGLFGYLNSGEICNLTIDGFSITSNHWAGTVLGWGKGVTISGCTVKNGTVTVAAEKVSDDTFDNGDKVGAVVGWIGAKSAVTSNVVENVTLTAYRDCGGVVGYAENSSVTGNTTTGVVLIQDLQNNYKNYTAEEAATYVGDIIGRKDGNVTDTDNTGVADINTPVAEGVSEGEEGVYCISSPAGMKWFYEQMVDKKNNFAGKTVKLVQDIDMSGIEWDSHSEKGNTTFFGVFDGNGKTISNFNAVASTSGGYAAMFEFFGGEAKNVTFDGVTATDNNSGGRASVLAGYAFSTKLTGITVRNAEVTGFQKLSALVGNFPESGSELTIEDCHVEKLTFKPVGNGSCWQAGAIIGYATAYKSIDVKNCSVKNITFVKPATIAQCTDQPFYCHPFIGNLDYKSETEAIVTLENNIISGTNTETDVCRVGAGKYFGYSAVEGTEYRDNKHLTIIVDGQKYTAEVVIANADDLVWFAGEVNKYSNYEYPFKDQTVKLTNDIDLGGMEWTPIGDYRFSANRFCGTFDGQGHEISNFKITKKTDKNDSNKSSYGFFGNLEGNVKNLTLSDVTIDGAPKFAAVLVGRINSGKIENCHVKSSNVYLRDNWTLGGLVAQWNDGVISGCTVEDTHIEGGAGAGAVAGLALNSGDRFMENCHVKNCTILSTDIFADPHAKMFGTVLGAVYGENLNVNLNGCTVENTTVNGASTDALCEFVSESGKLFIDGYEYIADGVYKKTDAYYLTKHAGLTWFAAQVNAGTTFSKQTVYLTKDIDLASEPWTPIGNSTNKFQGTFDAQGHTISNLVVDGGSSSDQGLFGMTVNGEIKNLTVNNAKVTGRLNVGVVAGTPYTSKYTNIMITGHVEVNGMAYVGAVGGKNAYANWTDITVDVDNTSYVKADSREDGKAYRTYVGGVVGFNGEGGHSFTNITSNIDVTGSTIDVGGLFGIAHYGNKFVNCSCSGDVEITDAEEAADAEEIGGIAGVWMNTVSDVIFQGCSFTGTLKTNITVGVDLSDNTIVGKGYNAETTNNLIIK